MNDKEHTFLSVLEAHKGILYKVAHSYCRDQSDREDLVQEIVVQIWVSFDRYEPKFKWSTWIYRVALNTAISFYRQHKTRKERTQPLPAFIELVEEEGEDAENEDLRLLRRFIRELREMDRALILLHLEGLSTQEIATVVNTSPTNVTTKISRIRKKLRRKFEQHNPLRHGQS